MSTQALVISGFAQVRPLPFLAALVAERLETIVPEGVSFPHADRLERVADMVAAIAGAATTAPDLVEHWGFDVRPSSYCGAAAEYLGLLDRERSEWRTTAEGKRFMSLRGRDDRRVSLTHSLLARPALVAAARVAVTSPSPESLTDAMFTEVHPREIGPSYGRAAAAPSSSPAACRPRP
ncbi:MAG: hypothetical protein RL199_1595 [Pseudomonadota bacterium]|jgi:hypothetical protein